MTDPVVVEEPRLLPGDFAIWFFIFAELLVFAIAFISYAVVRIQNVAMFDQYQLTLNRELGADFDVEQFQHRAFYNEDERRIEMHLVCMQDQQVKIENQIILFKKDQSIVTEYSHKYSVEGFQKLAEQAGFKSVKTWVDDDRLFSVHYLQCG